MDCDYLNFGHSSFDLVFWREKWQQVERREKQLGQLLAMEPHRDSASFALPEIMGAHKTTLLLEDFAQHKCSWNPERHSARAWKL